MQRLQPQFFSGVNCTHLIGGARHAAFGFWGKYAGRSGGDRGGLGGFHGWCWFHHGSRGCRPGGNRLRSSRRRFCWRRGNGRGGRGFNCRRGGVGFRTHRCFCGRFGFRRWRGDGCDLCRGGGWCSFRRCARRFRCRRLRCRRCRCCRGRCGGLCRLSFCGCRSRLGFRWRRCRWRSFGRRWCGRRGLCRSICYRS